MRQRQQRLPLCIPERAIEARDQLQAARVELGIGGILVEVRADDVGERAVEYRSWASGLLIDRIRIEVQSRFPARDIGLEAIEQAGAIETGARVGQLVVGKVGVQRLLDRAVGKVCRRAQIERVETA